VFVFRLPVPLPPDHFAKLIGTTGEGDGHTLIRENSSGEGFRHFFLLLSDTWGRYGSYLSAVLVLWDDLVVGFVPAERFIAKWGVLGTRSSYRRGTELVGEVVGWACLVVRYSGCCRD